MSRLREDERGFTLVELLVTMAIGMVGLGGVLTVLEVMLRQSHASRQATEAQDQARTAVDRLQVSVRNALASPGVTPTAVERAEPFDLIFQTADPFATVGTTTTANNLKAMRVRYCFDATDPQRSVLRMQTQRWDATSSPPMPTATACTAAANGWDASTVVATDLVNRIRTPERRVWTYSPPGYTSLAMIRGIDTTLVVDREPGNARGERTLSSGVTLRNANRPPVADFTVSRSGGYVVLNAATSFDPDSDALTYKWFIDGVEQVGDVGRQIRRFGLSAGTHTFRLEVRDPTGLLGERTRTVIVG